MAAAENGRPLGDLFGGLASDISGLFRKEIELAKAEAGEKFDNVMKSTRNLLIGAVLAIGAIGVFLAALVNGIAALLVRMGMAEGSASFLFGADRSGSRGCSGLGARLARPRRTQSQQAEHEPHRALPSNGCRGR